MGKKDGRDGIVNFERWVDTGQYYVIILKLKAMIGKSLHSKKILDNLT